MQLKGIRWLLPVVMACTSMAAEADLAKRYTDLAKQLDAEQKNFVSALYRAKTREQAKAAWQLKPNTSDYVAKMREIAKTDPKSAEGFAAADYIVSSSPGSEEADEAYRTVSEHHRDKKNLKRFQKYVSDWPSEAGMTFLRTTAEKATNNEARGHAQLTLGKLLLADSRHQGDAGKSLRDEARTMLESVIKDFGSLKSDEGKSYAEIARSLLSQSDARPKVGLEVGALAPEISGPNTKGETMRLSGSRGSVVALVFWANWCPWCHDVHPFGRSLKYLFGDRPFVLLGVNGDGDPEILKRVMADESVTWPNWWLGRNPEIVGN